MKYYSYYPGCSLGATAVAYEASARAVSSALEVELIELEDWNCCGATAYFAIDGLLASCLAARNLALAEQRGLDVVAPCSGCYTALNKTAAYLKEYPEVKTKVNEALAAADLHYDGGVKVRHLVDVLLNDVGLGTIQRGLSRRLEGLKVAPYYGCQLVRPAPGFDDPELPRSVDDLVRALPSLGLVNSQPGRNELVYRGISSGTGEYYTETQTRTSLEKYCRERRVIPLCSIRWCTARWKVRPVARWMDKHGIGRKLLGFDAGEGHRIKGRNIEDFPLADRGIDRNGCKRTIIEAGFPLPPKSSCFFCPFQSLHR